MKNILKVDTVNNLLVMDRTFAKAAEIVGSEEYVMLQNARHDYPTYRVVRKQIKRNAAKECYRGLTYEYMEGYIMRHGTEEQRLTNLRKYAELREIAECQGKRYRYPVIKSWFLEKYPEIARFGMTETEIAIEEAKAAIVNAEPIDQQEKAA